MAELSLKAMYETPPQIGITKNYKTFVLIGCKIWVALDGSLQHLSYTGFV